MPLVHPVVKILLIQVWCWLGVFVVCLFCLVFVWFFFLTKFSLCPCCIHHTFFSSYQNLCSVKLSDLRFPAVELCCEFPCSAKEENLLFFLHPKGTLLSATSSDCHSYAGDHRGLTMAFLLQLLAPKKCHRKCGMPTDPFPWLGRTP